MKRVAYEEMVAQFTRVLGKHGFTPSDAKDAAVIFAQNSLSGVYSHGLNRFPRVVSYLEKGEIDPLARAECISRMGSMERWDGHRGFGPLNAQRAMERACALAKENGVGIVALGNNNHRPQTRAASASAGRTPPPICLLGAPKTAASAITRSSSLSPAPTVSTSWWTAP